MKYRYFDLITGIVGEFLGLYGIYKHETFYLIAAIFLIIMAKNQPQDYLRKE